MADVYDIENYQPRKGVGHLLNRVRTEMLTALDKALEGDAEFLQLEISSAQFIVISALASAGREVRLRPLQRHLLRRRGHDAQ